MKKLLGFVLAALFCVGASAAYVSYVGFNPTLNQEGMPGANIDLSPAPVIAMTGQTISAQVGGQNAGSFVATGATTGASTITFPQPAAHGWACTVQDLTTTGDFVRQSATTTTVATFVGTIVSADKFQYSCTGY